MSIYFFKIWSLKSGSDIATLWCIKFRLLIFYVRAVSWKSAPNDHNLERSNRCSPSSSFFLYKHLKLLLPDEHINKLFVFTNLKNDFPLNAGKHGQMRASFKNSFIFRWKCFCSYVIRYVADKSMSVLIQWST